MSSTPQRSQQPSTRPSVSSPSTSSSLSSLPPTLTIPILPSKPFEISSSSSSKSFQSQSQSSSLRVSPTQPLLTANNSCSQEKKAEEDGMYNKQEINDNDDNSSNDNNNNNDNNNEIEDDDEGIISRKEEFQEMIISIGLNKQQQQQQQQLEQDKETNNNNSREMMITHQLKNNNEKQNENEKNDEDGIKKKNDYKEKELMNSSNSSNNIDDNNDNHIENNTIDDVLKNNNSNQSEDNDDDNSNNNHNNNNNNNDSNHKIYHIKEKREHDEEEDYSDILNLYDSDGKDIIVEGKKKGPEDQAIIQGGEFIKVNNGNGRIDGEDRERISFPKQHNNKHSQVATIPHRIRILDNMNLEDNFGPSIELRRACTSPPRNNLITPFRYTNNDQMNHSSNNDIDDIEDIDDDDDDHRYQTREQYYSTSKSSNFLGGKMKSKQQKQKVIYSPLFDPQSPIHNSRNNNRNNGNILENKNIAAFSPTSKKNIQKRRRKLPLLPLTGAVSSCLYPDPATAVILEDEDYNSNNVHNINNKDSNRLLDDDDNYNGSSDEDGFRYDHNHPFEYNTNVNYDRVKPPYYIPPRHELEVYQDRWAHQSKLAGDHSQNMRILDLTNRVLHSLEALEYGVPPQTAAVITELSFRNDSSGTGGEFKGGCGFGEFGASNSGFHVPALLDTFQRLFPRLERLTLLMDNKKNDSSIGSGYDAGNNGGVDESLEIDDTGMVFQADDYNAESDENKNEDEYEGSTSDEGDISSPFTALHRQEDPPSTSSSPFKNAKKQKNKSRNNKNNNQTIKRNKKKKNCPPKKTNNIVLSKAMMEATMDFERRESDRMQRLYILYRLPDLTHINGTIVTDEERQLARPSPTKATTPTTSNTNNSPACCSPSSMSGDGNVSAINSLSLSSSSSIVGIEQRRRHKLRDDLHRIDRALSTEDEIGVERTYSKEIQELNRKGNVKTAVKFPTFLSTVPTMEDEVGFERMYSKDSEWDEETWECCGTGIGGEMYRHHRESLLSLQKRPPFITAHDPNEGGERNNNHHQLTTVTSMVDGMGVERKYSRDSLDSMEDDEIGVERRHSRNHSPSHRDRVIGDTNEESIKDRNRSGTADKSVTVSSSGDRGRLHGGDVEVSLDGLIINSDNSQVCQDSSSGGDCGKTVTSKGNTLPTSLLSLSSSPATVEGEVEVVGKDCGYFLQDRALINHPRLTSSSSSMCDGENIQEVVLLCNVDGQDKGFGGELKKGQNVRRLLSKDSNISHHTASQVTTAINAIEVTTVDSSSRWSQRQSSLSPPHFPYPSTRTCEVEDNNSRNNTPKYEESPLPSMIMVSRNNNLKKDSSVPTKSDNEMEFIEDKIAQAMEPELTNYPEGGTECSSSAMCSINLSSSSGAALIPLQQDTYLHGLSMLPPSPQKVSKKIIPDLFPCTGRSIATKRSHIKSSCKFSYRNNSRDPDPINYSANYDRTQREDSTAHDFNHRVKELDQLLPIDQCNHNDTNHNAKFCSLPTMEEEEPLNVQRLQEEIYLTDNPPKKDLQSFLAKSKALASTKSKVGSEVSDKRSDIAIAEKMVTHCLSKKSIPSPSSSPNTLESQLDGLPHKYQGFGRKINRWPVSRKGKGMDQVTDVVEIQTVDDEGVHVTIRRKTSSVDASGDVGRYKKDPLTPHTIAVNQNQEEITTTIKLASKKSGRKSNSNKKSNIPDAPVPSLVNIHRKKKKRPKIKTKNENSHGDDSKAFSKRPPPSPASTTIRSFQPQPNILKKKRRIPRTSSQRSLSNSSSSAHRSNLIINSGSMMDNFIDDDDDEDGNDNGNDIEDSIDKELEDDEISRRVTVNGCHIKGNK